MLAPVGQNGHNDCGGSNSDEDAYTTKALVVTHENVNVQGVQSDDAQQGDHRHATHRICGMPRALAWEVWTVALLFFVYSMVYFARDHLFVVETSFMRDEGVSSRQLGVMMAIGYAVYPIGKCLSGYAADKAGGRVALAACMLGAGVTSVLFGVSSSYWLFVVSWAALRFFQPAGWPGVVKVAGQWVPPSRQGFVLGVLSLSFLGGDVVARAVLGLMVEAGASWSTVVVVGGVIAMATTPIIAFALKSSPAVVGLPLPQCRGSGRTGSLRHQPVSRDGDVEMVGAPRRDESPAEPSQGTSGGTTDAVRDSVPPSNASAQLSLGVAIARLLHHPMFVLVCVQSVLLTSIRETFNTLTVAYLETIGASGSTAAALSALMPLAGVPSTLLTGWGIDKLPHRWRGFVLPAWISLLVLGTLIMAADSRPSIGVAGFCLFIVGLGLLGPYTLLSGAFALEIGGNESAGLCSSIVDACGYVGAMGVMLLLAADVGILSLFRLLFVLSLCALGIGTVLAFVMRRSRRG